MKTKNNIYCTHRRWNVIYIERTVHRTVDLSQKWANRKEE